jgi:tetraacyldisaccharide 4'-kinase
MQMHPVLLILAAPVSWGYGLATGLRNALYDIGLIKSFKSDIPVIVVGNLVAGGTGKTPVVAWLAQELGRKYRIAILSRGYGRRTKGFHLADQAPSPEIIGDEPAELRMLLPDTLIAVDRNRTRGIKTLTSGLFGKIDLILMDDGFQHRRVKPGFALILDSAYRPMAKEKLLPAGLRRESQKSLKRADLVVTTHAIPQPPLPGPSSEVILITGIANPQPLIDRITQTHKIIQHLQYPDHHPYTPSDINLIASLCPCAPVPLCPKFLTTGKDFVKLRRFPELRHMPLEYISAGPAIDVDIQKLILNKILHYVEQNS